VQDVADSVFYACVILRCVFALGVRYVYQYRVGFL